MRFNAGRIAIHREGIAVKILLPASRILILSLALALLVSCGGDGTLFNDVEPPPLPVPALEITRPIVNTDLTYYRLVEVDIEERDRWVEVAEDALMEVAASGVAMQDAWATPYFVSSKQLCHIGGVGPLLTVRLAEADPSIHEFGFTEDPILSWDEQMCMDRETRHYGFRARPDVGVPERVLELGRPMGDTSTLFHRLWTQAHPCDAVCAGVESFLGTLVEEGVDLRNAWYAASTVGHEFDVYALVVEVGEVHPILERSGFLEEPYNSWNAGVALMWNHCFTGCPEQIAFPRPYVGWLAPLYPGPRIHYRSVPSSEYDDLISDRADAEKELQRLARGGLEIRQAWIPTGRSEGEYTNIIVELAVEDYRIAGWGYSRAPSGDPPEFPWDFVWHYDLSR
jgi:hypothetical protein